MMRDVVLAHAFDASQSDDADVGTCERHEAASQHPPYVRRRGGNVTQWLTDQWDAWWTRMRRSVSTLLRWHVPAWTRVDAVHVRESSHASLTQKSVLQSWVDTILTLHPTLREHAESSPITEETPVRVHDDIVFHSLSDGMMAWMCGPLSKAHAQLADQTRHVQSEMETHIVNVLDPLTSDTWETEMQKVLREHVV